MDDEEVVLSPETVKLITREQRGCFLCKWIIEDFNDSGKLTGYPVMYDRTPIFPVKAKVRHIEIVKASGGRHHVKK